MSRKTSVVLAAAAALAACLLVPAGSAAAIPATALRATALPAAPVQATRLAAAAPQGSLAGVSASSASDAWAVGCLPATFQCPGEGVDAAYHWNGKTWKRFAVPMPVPPNPLDTLSGQLNGVKAISPADAWAVGSAATGAQIAHWNGRAWQQVAVPALPAPYGIDYTLTAVGASSPSNVWAVGFAGNGATVTLHFNGKSWKRIASPSPGVTNLYGVTVTSAGNAWAVGTDGGTCSCGKSLIMRWNGKAWKVVLNAYTVPLGNSVLHSVAAVSGTNAWADGYMANNQILTLNWNGKAWKRVTAGIALPNPASVTAAFGVAATSSRDVWAVGTRILHWNGKAWKIISIPKLPALGLGLLYGVAATSGANAWAVGYYNTAGVEPGIVILHWNGKTWARAV
jgi:hypothetical protein